MILKRSKTLVSIFIVCCITWLASPVMGGDYIYAPVSNALHVIDCSTDTVIKTIPYNDYIFTSCPSPDGKRYYLNAFHSIYVIDTVTDTLIDTFKLSSELSKVTMNWITVSNDNSKIFISCSIVKKKQNIPKLNVLPPQLVVFDVKARKMVKSYPIPVSSTASVTLKNDPDSLILLGQDVHKLNLKTGKMEKIMGLLYTEKPEEAKNALAFWNNGSPGDHGLFINPYYDAKGLGYIVVDRNTGKVSEFRGKDVWFEYSAVISPDKKYAYGVMDELVKVDMATGETVKAVSIPMGTSYALSLTSDGKKIYVGPGGADISVFDTETLELLSVIPLDADGITAHRISK